MSDMPGGDGLEESVEEPGLQAAAVQRGAVLRAWRSSRGLGLDAVARHADMSDTALSDWERGELQTQKRRVYEPLQKVTRIDERLEAGGALRDLWQAVGTRQALPPRSDWMFNYRIGGKPGWLWIRSSWQCTVDLSWGPLRGRATVSPGADGLLVQLPITVDNPPLRAATTAPAWIDFGAGVVPEAVAAQLGITWVLARDLHQARPATRRVPVAPDFFPSLGRVAVWADELRLGWQLIWPHAGAVLFTGELAERALDGADVQAQPGLGEVRFDPLGRLVSQLTLQRRQLRTLRMARGYSHESAAAQVSAMDDHLPPLSHAALERAERLGAQPRAEQWLARLDMVYRADGRLGIERTFESEGADTRRGWRRGTRVTKMTFPAYWVGPVWLQVRSPGGRSDVGTLRMTWGPWRSHLRLRSGQVVTTRKARTDAVPLHVELPVGWQFVAGTGAVGVATDINDDWQPRTVTEGIALLEEALGTAPGSVDSLPVRLRPRWKDQHRAEAVPGGVPS